MSYDLMVFNPKTAPRSETSFIAWYESQVAWKEDHSYNDPKVSATQLQHWFMEMIIEFPALNGPHAPSDILERIDEENITDYCFGRDVIYSTFRWSVAEKAYPIMFDMAAKHGVGFFDASGDGSILFPNGNGKLELINKKVTPKPWWKFW